MIGRLYRVAASDWLLRRTTDIQGKPDVDKYEGIQISSAGVSLSNFHIALKNESFFHIQ